MIDTKTMQRMFHLVEELVDSHIYVCRRQQRQHNMVGVVMTEPSKKHKYSHRKVNSVVTAIATRTFWHTTTTNCQRIVAGIVVALCTGGTILWYNDHSATSPPPLHHLYDDEDRTTTTNGILLQKERSSDISLPQQPLTAPSPFHNHNNNRCIDDDDDVPLVYDTHPEDIVSKVRNTCDCPDPTVASYELRNQSHQQLTEWMQRHQLYIEDILQYETEIAHHPPPIGRDLDMVLLGDSILERWNRTQNRPSFTSFFDARRNNNNIDTTASIQGLAFGTAGDITTELLWHLQNGIILGTSTNTDGTPTVTTLQPKVWFVLIGTNDLGRTKCSKRTTLAGIVHVVQYLHTHRPNVPILVHGLLPRADTYRQQNYTLGRYWNDIVWINKELERLCSLHPMWYYMESSDLFLTNVTLDGAMTTNSDDADHSNKYTMIINKHVMSDSLHPDLEGYNLWGERIVEYALKLISPE
jgi:lysophospholipase L1-like esterase